MMEEIRNPVFLEDGRIDCEVEHPVYGWIPYTASADDAEPVGRAIFAAAEASGPAPYVAPVIDPADVLAAERAAMKCSRFQAKAAMLLAGMLPAVEAQVATSSDMIKLAWADATEFRRDSPAVTGLAAAMGLTDAQIDDLFRAAMGITA